MRKICLLLAVVSAIVACKEVVVDSTIFSGIGTIERYDTLFAIHYYDHTFLLSDMDGSSLEDSDRVVVECKAAEE